MKTLLFALVFSCFIACHNEEKNVSEAKRPSAVMAMSVMVPPNLAAEREIITDQKLIREATLVFEVTEVELTYDSIRNLLPRLQAYTVNEHQNNNTTCLEQNMEIRVKAENLDNLIARITSFATTVKSKTVSVEDVTASWVDTEARLKTKKELEVRYHEILKQARSVKDILAIEEQIGSVREEIESMESRIIYLRGKTFLGTLRITFSETIADDPGFGSKVADAMISGLGSLRMFLLMLISLWPVLMGVSTAVIMIRLYWKRKRKLAPQ